MRDGVSAEWPFLCDPDRTIQRDLDIAEYTDPHHNPMIPHTFVLAPGLVIHSIYNGYWFWGRPTNEDLRQDLRRVFAQCRPDWDLAAPGLRERYDAGDREVFWPYRAKPAPGAAAGGGGKAGGADGAGGAGRAGAHGG